MSRFEEGLLVKYGSKVMFGHHILRPQLEKEKNKEEKVDASEKVKKKKVCYELFMFIKVLFLIVSYECFDFWKSSVILVIGLINVDCKSIGKLCDWLSLGRICYLVKVLNLNFTSFISSFFLCSKMNKISSLGEFDKCF